MQGTSIEALAPSNAPTVLMVFSLDQFVGQALVIVFSMVMHDEFGDGPAEVSLAQRSQPVQALLLERADKSLRVRIAVRCSKRDLQFAYACRLKEIPNIGAPFPVAVADQDSPIAAHAVKSSVTALTICRMNASFGFGVDLTIRTRRECSSITNSV